MIDTDYVEKILKIKLVLMDCDGVLTDGRLTLLPNGDEQKTFHVRDGQGLVLLHRAGLRSGIISGRNSSLVDQRAKELGVEFVRQGVRNKLEDFENILTIAKIRPDETAFIGDDIADIPLLQRVGFAVAVNDAAKEVKKEAHFITGICGGYGAVRELTDLILYTQQKWHIAMKNYFS